MTDPVQDPHGRTGMATGSDAGVYERTIAAIAHDSEQTYPPIAPGARPVRVSAGRTWISRHPSGGRTTGACQSMGVLVPHTRQVS